MTRKENMEAAMTILTAAHEGGDLIRDIMPTYLRPEDINDNAINLIQGFYLLTMALMQQFEVRSGWTRQQMLEFMGTETAAMPDNDFNSG